MLGSRIATENSYFREDPLGSVPLRDEEAKGPPTLANDPPAALSAAVKGQFEDADDDNDELVAVPPSGSNTNDQSGHSCQKEAAVPRLTNGGITTTATTTAPSRNPLDFLAAACGQEALAMPEKAPLQRRISSTTCDATQSLLHLANSFVSSKDVKHNTDSSEMSNRGRKPQKSWEMRVEELAAFKQKHGHLKIRQAARGCQHHKELGAWLANARCRYRAGKLNPQRAEELRRIGCEGFCEEDLEKANDKQAPRAQEHWDEAQDLKKAESDKARKKVKLEAKPRPERPASLPQKASKSHSKAPRTSMPYPPPEAAKHPLVRAIWGAPPPEAQLEPDVQKLVERRPTQKAFKSVPMPAPVRRGADPDGTLPSEMYPEKADEDDVVEENNRPTLAQHPGPYARELPLVPPPASAMSSLLPSGNAISMMRSLPPGMDPRVVALMRQRQQQQAPFGQPSIAALRERAWLQQRRASNGSSYTHSSHDGEEGDNASEGGSKANTKGTKKKSWAERMLQMREFFLTYGHCKVSTRGEHRDLGRWLSSTRGKVRDGSLPRARLEEFWSMQDWPKATANAEFSASVPRRADPPEEGSGPGEFYSDEEDEKPDAGKQLKRKGAEITPANSAPSSPAVGKKRKRVRHSYSTRVEQIKAFKEKHGHCQVRINSEDKAEEQLGRWLTSARSRFRIGQFKPERAEELRQLGCTGFEPLSSTGGSAKSTDSVRAATPSPSPGIEGSEDEEGGDKKRLKTTRPSWDLMLEEVKAYLLTNGANCSVPMPNGEEGKLGRWLAFQRRQYLAGSLKPERLEKLRALGREEFFDKPVSGAVESKDKEAKPMEVGETP